MKVKQTAMADYANNKFEITKLTKSIVALRTFEGVRLKPEDVKEMKDVMLKLTKGKKYAVLRYADDYFYSSHKIRTLIASNRFVDSRYAIAFVIKSLANRLSAQFFIQFYVPVTLSKVFDDDVSALQWLKRQEALQYGKK